MFWRFGGYANISTIDTLLEKPTVTLEELLDESDLIQELKQHNTKLIEFLRDDAIIRRLLEYVIAPKPTSIKPITSTAELVAASGEKTPPPEEEDKITEEESSEHGSVNSSSDDPASTSTGLSSAPTSPQKTAQNREQDEKMRLKYAYVACEVLSSEAWSLSEALMHNIDHLRLFWKFLNRPAPLDPLQAGYFTKVNETLLDKKTEEMMNFFKSIEDIVPMMLTHVDCPMVMDLLLKIVSMEKSEGGAGIVDWLQAKGLIPRLLSFLSPNHPSTTQTSTGDFLKAIITISANASQNETSCIGPNNLTRQLVSEECIQTLINEMLKGGNPLTVGVGIIIEVIRKNNSDYDPEVTGGIDAVPSGRDPIYLGTLLKLFARHVKDFMKLILTQNLTVVNLDGTTTLKKRELKAAFGGTIEPLGFDRFKTCELMAELLHCSNMGLLNERGGENYVKNRDRERNRLKALENGKGQPSLAPSISFTRPDEETSPRSTDSVKDDSGGSKEKEEDDEFENIAVRSPSTDANANAAEEDKVTEPSRSKQASPLPDDSSDSEISAKESLALDPTLTAPLTEGGVSSTADTSKDLDVPLSAPSGALSPTTDLSSYIKDISMDEDTEMTSSSVPDSEDVLPATDSKSSGMEEILERPDEHMTSPPPLLPKHLEDETNTTPDSKLEGQQASKNISSISQSTLELNKDLPSLPTEGASSTEIQPDSVYDADDLGLDSLLLKTEGLELDTTGNPLVGDYLKMMFVQHFVVPTIFDFFFRFPWNNFLHNVVYDVVQQVFNGPMEKGFNRHLAIDLFNNGLITQRIVEGQRQSDRAQEESNMRLGYMGHLTLIAEEVVKFTERHPPEMLSTSVMEKALDRNWVFYVEHTLVETRERDNAILGGVRPDLVAGTRQTIINTVNSNQNLGNTAGISTENTLGSSADDDTDDIHNGMSEVMVSNTTGEDSFGDIHVSNSEGNEEELSRGRRNEGTLSSGFGSSSDDEDEDEEMGMGDENDEDVSRVSTGGNGNKVSNISVISSSENPEAETGEQDPVKAAEAETQTTSEQTEPQADSEKQAEHDKDT